MKFDSTLRLKRPPQDFIDARRSKRMATVDSLPEEWRVLVHEYGLCVINALRDCGVEHPRHARHIIVTVLGELSPFGGSGSSQGERRYRDMDLIMVPRAPSEGMIEASMATVSKFEAAITKREKHRLRLQAALDVAIGAKRGHR